MLRQSLSQKLLQKLSPQQIQLMKLIQIPTAQIEQRIKEELEVNPALEEGDENEDDFLSDLSNNQEPESAINDSESEVSSDETSGDDFTDNSTEDSSEFDDSLEMSDYYDESDEGVAEYKLKDPNDLMDPDDENRSIPVAINSTFHEFLDEQVGLLDLDERESKIAYQLVGSIDDDGYLRRELDSIIDDLSFSQNISTDEAELKRILLLIQKFDPPGVGASNLAECLLLQLERKENNPVVRVAKKVIAKHFDAFIKKHYEKLQESLGLDDEEIKIVIEEIKSLNPKPGSTYGGGLNNEQYIIPDFIVSSSNGELILSLNSQNMPELRISNTFKDMLRDYKKSKTKNKEIKDALVFIKQKIDSAKWFIDAIKQRQATLFGCMTSILELQKDYFFTGEETSLKPMILKDVAERAGVDISTVSRVANSKYVQTEFGTIPLKFFFSEAMQTDSGEEVSSREVKKILSDVIESENKKKPFSDQELAEILNEKGYNIARRTVAKYREQLDYPVGRLRKEL